MPSRFSVLFISTVVKLAKYCDGFSKWISFLDSFTGSNLGFDSKNSRWHIQSYAVLLLEFKGISLVHGRCKLLQSF